MTTWTAWASEENRTTLLGSDGEFNVSGRDFNETGIPFDSSVTFEERDDIWTEVTGPES
jgi:hypothetical protein